MRWMIGLGGLVLAFSLPASAQVLKLTAEQERNFGVRLAIAAAAGETPLATLPAVATPPLNGRVVASAPFAGTVTRVDVLEGQAVRAGQQLAVLFSPGALEASSQLAQARAELGVAEAAAKRARTLAAEGIVAGARADEAEAKAAQARAVVSEKSRLVGGGRGGEYVLRAPIAGRVAQMNLAPGEGLEAMAPAVVIDRDDRIWLQARLPAALVGKVRIGSPVQVGAVRGRVVAAGLSIDPKTRSAMLRAELPTSAGLVPGRAANVTLLAPAPAGAVRVARTAVSRSGGVDTVFVRDAAGYRAAPVRVLGYSADQAVVTGVAAGARVVVAGVAQIKSAAGK